MIKVIKYKEKLKKGEFPIMSLGTSGESLLRNLVTGRWVKGKTLGEGVLRTGEGRITTYQIFLMLDNPLTNFEMKQIQNDSKFKGVCSKNNLSKMILFLNRF